MTHSTTTERVRCWLKVGGQEIELRVGRTLLGRHDSCEVVLDDPLASRRHAALHFDGQATTVQDLGSVNGVLLNGERIKKPEKLTHGDELRLGNQSIQVRIGVTAPVEDAQRRWGAETISAMDAQRLAEQSIEESTGVRDGEALETLMVVAEKMIALGRPAEAERIVKSALTELRSRAENGPTDADTLELAAVMAVRLAEANRRGEWVTYVFALYDAAGGVVPASVIDRLYSAVRVVDSVDLTVIRGYMSKLRARQADFGPAQRFLLRRLDGLEQLASVS